MRAFIEETGHAALILDANVNTDTIIRMDRLMMAPRKALGDYALEVLRYHPDGRERADFILNQVPFRDSPIFIVGENFGCGSSREAAVWALTNRGVRCLIGLSFGDIFKENCFKNGLLPIELDAESHQQLVEAWHRSDMDARRIQVNLQRCILSMPSGFSLPFAVSPFARERLLIGEDEISATMKHAAEINTHLARFHQAMPWTRIPEVTFDPPATTAASPTTSSG